MHRRHRHHRWIPAAIVLLIVYAVFLEPGCGRRTGRSRASPRGVILISVDTLGAGHVGVYGYERATTPNIDRWAQGAIVFKGAYAQLPGTLPSHMSMLTGRYPREHGVYPSRTRPVALAPEIRTLAEHLQDAGFRTAGFTEGGYVAGLYGFARGFDEFVDRFASWHNVLHSAHRFLRSVGEEESYFLFLHTYQVHDPYRPPTDFAQLFWKDGPALPFEPSGANLTRVNRGELSVTLRDVSHLKTLHDAEIRFFDHRFPDLLATLDETDLRKRTLVILTSDHGEEFMEHGRLVHEQIFEPTTRVPLVIDVPGWDGRRTVPELVELVDLPASILSWAGIPRPPELGGQDLLALARRNDEVGRSWAYCESFVGPEKALAARLDGRELKILTTGPLRPAGSVELSKTSLLFMEGRMVRFRLRADGPPVKVDVLIGDGVAETWTVTSEWKDHLLRFDTDTALPVPVLFMVKVDHQTNGSLDHLVSGSLHIDLSESQSFLFPEIRLFDLNADPDERYDLSENEPQLVIRLAGELAGRLEAQQLVAAPVSVTLPKRQRQRLEALGYLQ